MTATLTSIEYLGARSWRATASSGLTDPVFRWWLRGELIREGAEPSIDFSVRPDYVPDIEVLDDGAESQQVQHPGRLAIQWWLDPANVDIRRFEVRRVEAVTTVIARLPETGRGYYRVNTAYLDDVTIHRFQVVAIDSHGNKLVIVDHDTLIVRRPTITRWQASRNADASLTIAS